MAIDSESPNEAQVFDVAEALQEADNRSKAVPGRVDMATTSSCYVAFFRTNPGKGESHIHSHPDSDQILFVLKGECTVDGVGTRYVLTENQGVLIPAGVNYGFTNLTDQDMMFLSMRTESTGGRRVGYVPTVPSDAVFKIPQAALAGHPVERELHVYALDRRTIGISPVLLEEWNRGAILRMSCACERHGEYVFANLPERMAKWYDAEDLAEGDYNVEADPDSARVRIDLSPLIDRRAARR